jgi:hypothetical protein
MKDNTFKTAAYDDESINYDDIPKITDFSKAIKNPFAGKFKDGYTIIAEHKDYDEIITVTKTRKIKGT